MEENPPRVSSNRESQDHEASSRGGGGPTRSRNRRRFTTVDESGDLIECSRKYCLSCTAGIIADCVALCCCPCFVLHCFALAFVKAPWMVGRRCLGLEKKKKYKGQTQRHEQNDGVLERNTDGNLTKGWDARNGLCLMKQRKWRVSVVVLKQTRFGQSCMRLAIWVLGDSSIF